MLDIKKSALLGYAIMSFADLSDMGRGPAVELNKLNAREVTATRISALKAAVGADPNDATKPYTRLNRFSPDNAMFMLVKASLVDPSSLCKDPFSSEFNQVRWTKDAKALGAVASLINGNTRRELCSHMGKQSISEYEAVQTQYQKSSGAAREELQKERIRVATKVRVDTSWIVAFFDKGA